MILRWFTSLWYMPRMHPTHGVSDSWEVPLIWPMRWEMWIETIARPMDASEIVVLSMSRMARVQPLDLGSSLVRFRTSNWLRVSETNFGLVYDSLESWWGFGPPTDFGLGKPTSGWHETLCESYRGFGPLGWICQPGMMSLWLTHFCFEIKSQQSKLWRDDARCLDCIGGWSSP